MAEKQQENEIVTEKVTKVKPRSKTWIWLATLLILIIVLASIGIYLLLQLNDKQATQKTRLANENLRVIELTKQINSTQTQLASIQAQLISTEANITGTDDVFNQRLAKFSKRHDEKLQLTHTDLKQTILHLQRQLGKTRGDWLMADAEYLLSVANQRLYLMADLKTTLEALKAADQRLRESGDASAFKVRGQIIKEMATLKEVSVNDVVGSYARLQVLIDKIETLTLILPYAAKPWPTSKKVQGHVENSHSFMNLVLKQLEGYATVRHSHQSVDKILTREQAALIKQQLSLKLEMVKVALVQKNKSVYQISVDDTLKWLQAHFTKNELSKKFIAELHELSKMQIYSQLPDISRSLKMLRDITKLRIETDKALVGDMSLAPIDHRAKITDKTKTKKITRASKNTKAVLTTPEKKSPVITQPAP